jgi:CRP-like cAMP-binding protein
LEQALIRLAAPNRRLALEADEMLLKILLWLALALAGAALWAHQMRRLRILAALAALPLLVLTVMLHDFFGAGLSLILLIVNMVQLSRLGGGWGGDGFTDDERLMHDAVLPTLDTSEARRLMAQGEWRTALTGAELMQENQRMPELVYIARGAAVVEMGGKLVGVCGPGDFLGEMSFMSGHPASATVRVANQIRYCAFDRTRISEFLDKNPELRTALEAGFNRNLAGKLVRMNETASGKPLSL